MEKFPKMHKEEYEDLLKSKEEKDFKEAKEIFGDDFLGPEAVENAFGIKPEEIPEIPFSKEDLKRAKELGQQLIFYVDKTPDGKPLTGKKLFKITNGKKSDNKRLFWDNIGWFKNEDFFNKETPKQGWKLVSKETIPDLTRNHLEQTEAVISYLKDRIFKDEQLPDKYQKAIDEFNSKKNELKELFDSDRKKLTATKELVNLEITNLTRETPIEIIYRLTLNERENKIRLLPNTYSWTSRQSSHNGRLVSIGCFDSTGMDVNGYGPIITSDIPYGVSFSRSF